MYYNIETRFASRKNS